MLWIAITRNANKNFYAIFRYLPERQYAKFNLQGEIDYITNEAWYYIETSLQMTLPYERDSLYVEVYPFDISFDDSFTKVQLWLPVNQDDYNDL